MTDNKLCSFNNARSVAVKIIDLTDEECDFEGVQREVSMMQVRSTYAHHAVAVLHSRVSICAVVLRVCRVCRCVWRLPQPQKQ